LLLWPGVNRNGESREGEILILMGSDSQFRLSVYMYADEVDECVWNVWVSGHMVVQQL